ncbi:hypothetical protein A3Q56_02610 [Intoshia linei]|uniref:VWFA domain-containing protein n=1 Tax=Intoshia linei TaxID=1819745 RepID=A0A177B876_9BILA|nr:hypothetical protein A3Q56_02610 [Intoshia linei]
MTIILFLIDSSASMMQSVSAGLTFMDMAKIAIDYFLKCRARDHQSKMDRYMLLSFEEPPNNIKAGWKENQAIFTEELKNFKSTGLTTTGNALKNTFQLLNINRLQTGVDTYGQGRTPYFLEPAIIVFITDGCQMNNPYEITNDIQLSLSEIPGLELTYEPFRWDQKLFVIVLQIPGIMVFNDSINFTSSYSRPTEIQLKNLCQHTGGEFYAVNSVKCLMAAVENIITNVYPSIQLLFSCFNSDELENIKDSRDISSIMLRSDDWHNSRSIIRIDMSNVNASLHWPIPEEFFPDTSLLNLPPRNTIPVVFMASTPCEISDNYFVTVDKLPLNACTLSKFMIANDDPSTCRYLYIPNSLKSGGLGKPFGYLHVNETKNRVILVLSCYNFPAFYTIVNSIMFNQKFKNHKEEYMIDEVNKQKLDIFIKSIPAYYISNIHKVLAVIKIQNYSYEIRERSLSYNISSYIKKTRVQAKTQLDTININVSKNCNKKIKNKYINVQINENRFKHNIKDEIDPNPYKSFRISDHYKHSINDICKQAEKNNVGFSFFNDSEHLNYGELLRREDNALSKSFSNLLLESLINNIESCTMKSDLADLKKHSTPINKMGDYISHLEKMTPVLRHVEIQPKRINMFGNPFNVKMHSDEVDDMEPDREGDGRKEESLVAKEKLKRKTKKIAIPPKISRIAVDVKNLPVNVQPLPTKQISKSVDQMVKNKILYEKSLLLMKTPGHDFSKLYKCLKEYNDTFYGKKLFIQNLINEANKLNRKFIVTVLEFALKESI